MKLDISGLPEFKAQVEKLSRKMENQILKEALMAAGEPILISALVHVPRKTGTLASQLAMRYFPSRKHMGYVIVGTFETREGKRKPATGSSFTGAAFYGSFVEYGHFLGADPAKARGFPKFVQRDGETFITWPGRQAVSNRPDGGPPSRPLTRALHSSGLSPTLAGLLRDNRRLCCGGRYPAFATFRSDWSTTTSMSDCSGSFAPYKTR